MYCSKCGKKLNDGVNYCSECGGEATKEIVSSVEVDKKKVDKVKLIIFLIIGAVILFPILIIVVVFGIIDISFNKIINEKYYNFNGYEVPTYFYSVNKAKVCEYQTNVNNKDKKIEIRLCNKNELYDNVDKYINVLVNEYDFSYENKSEFRILKKELEDGYDIEIIINVGENKIKYLGMPE